MRYEQQGTVNQYGTLCLNSRERFKKALEGFIDNEGGQMDVFVSVETVKKERSYRQNRLLWGVIYPECQKGFVYHCGYEDTSLQDVHEFFKKRFLTDMQAGVSKTGKAVFKKASTTLLSSEQFKIYLEQIFQFSAEHLELWFEDI